MQSIAIRKMSSTVIEVMRASDQIAGYCPTCNELFRMSEVELFYIPDRKKDFLTELRKKQLELHHQIATEREDAIKRSRSSLMGRLFETVRPFLPEFSHHPGDLRSIWNPVDFVSFNGLALNRCVESITFVEVKSGRSTLTGVERSVREAIEHGKVSFESVTHPSLDGLIEVAEISPTKRQNKKH